MAMKGHTVFISVSALSLLLSSVVLLTQESFQDAVSMFTTVLPILAGSILVVIAARRCLARPPDGGD